MPIGKRAKTRRPTMQTRRGLLLILELIYRDFDNGFDRLFPDATDQEIMDILDAANWMEQYQEDGY